MKDRSLDYVNLLVNAAAIKPEAIVIAMVIGEILCHHFASHTTKTVQILAVLSNQANFRSHLTLNSSFLQHFKVSYLLGVLLPWGETTTKNVIKDDFVDPVTVAQAEVVFFEEVAGDADVSGENVARKNRKWNVHQRTREL